MHLPGPFKLRSRLLVFNIFTAAWTASRPSILLDIVICECSALHFSDTQQQLANLQYTMACTCSWWERLSCPAILPDRYRRQWKWIVTVSLAVVYFVSWGNIHSYPLLFGPLQEEFKTSAIETGKLIYLKSWKWQRLYQGYVSLTRISLVIHHQSLFSFFPFS